MKRKNALSLPAIAVAASALLVGGAAMSKTEANTNVAAQVLMGHSGQTSSNLVMEPAQRDAGGVISLGHRSHSSHSSHRSHFSSR